MNVQRIFPLVMVGFLAFSLAGCAKAERSMQNINDSAVNYMGPEVMSDMKECQDMMTIHLGKADQTYDKRFIDMMLPHHEGAITMAKDAMQKSQHPEIKAMAQNIIDNQQKEIDKLKTWREEWYGSATPSNDNN